MTLQKHVNGSLVEEGALFRTEFGWIRYLGDPQIRQDGGISVSFLITFTDEVFDLERTHPGNLESMIRDSFHGESPDFVGHKTYIVRENFTGPIRAPRGLLRHRLGLVRSNFKITKSWLDFEEDPEYQKL